VLARVLVRRSLQCLVWPGLSVWYIFRLVEGKTMTME